MKLDDLLRYLTQPGVAEVALQSGRLPCIAVEGKFKPVTDQALSAEHIARIVAITGGPKDESALGEVPTRWTMQSKVAGTVEAHAIKKGDALLLRFRRVPTRKSLRPSNARGLKPRASTKPPPRARMREMDSEMPAVLGRASLELDVPSVSTKQPRGIELDLALRGGAPAALVAEGRFQAAPDRLAELLGLARDAKASDLHLLADRPMLFLVAGDLAPQGSPLGADEIEQMILARVPEHLRSTLDTKGAVVFALADPKQGRCRVTVTKQRTGLKATFRLVPTTLPTLAALGLPDKLALLGQQKQGLVVVSGPPGHGKTTTVAALVDAINRETSKHVVTVEDPIEFVHPRKRALVTQREVGTHAQSFARALRSAMRADPDVLVIGALRDVESMRHALGALEKGHLVIGTIDAMSAAKTIERMIDFFVPAEQQRARLAIAAGLHLVVNQRLLPNQQHTALVPAVEVLPQSSTLAKLVRDGQTHEIPAMQQRGKALGLVRLDDSLAELVRTGRVDGDVARTHAENPDALGGPTAGAAPRAPTLLGKINVKKAGT
jgi:twitching motility protein PilT